jgi:hypothetical protein
VTAHARRQEDPALAQVRAWIEQLKGFRSLTEKSIQLAERRTLDPRMVATVGIPALHLERLNLETRLAAIGAVQASLRQLELAITRAGAAEAKPC